MPMDACQLTFSRSSLAIFSVSPWQGSHLEITGPRLQILDGPGGGRVALEKEVP